jgi:dTDP-4-amino-4,6-dideoxygalactose transaminase
MVEFLAAPGHAVGVGNGTDALAIALRALGIGPGDEVLTVSNTAVGTVSAIRMTGATPAYCDIDPRTLMMDPADARRRITPRIRAIIPVHLFGNAVDMRAIRELANERHLKIVEDCAQSCGTTFMGRATGTWGDVGCFSFYPTKNLAAYGDGGLCYTADEKLAAVMRQIRGYGCDAGGFATREGINSRLDEVQAAILQVKLVHFARDFAARARVAHQYAEGLSPHCKRLAPTEATMCSHCLFVVRVPDRPRVIAHLAAHGIECGVHYPIPIHLMPGYRIANYGPGSLPHTEQAAREVLSLPFYPNIPPDHVTRVISVLNEALN